MSIPTQLRNGLLLTMLATACSGAFAAESADLSVKGVIRPSACSVALSNNGTVDYGTISAKSLSATDVTKLPDRDVTMTINCEAATKVGFKVVDNRDGTASDVLNPIDPAAKGGVPFGLGAVDGKNLGGYGIQARVADATADGATVADVVLVNGDLRQLCGPDLGDWMVQHQWWHPPCVHDHFAGPSHRRWPEQHGQPAVVDIER
jgi:type 1 fimbria pilin